VTQRRAIRRLAPPALLLGIVATCVYALGGRLLPGPIDQVINSDRLSQPFLYWNSLGLFAGFGALIGVAIAGDESNPRLGRSIACAAAVPCGLACFLTLSRGAAAAVLVGLVVCLVARRGGATLLAAGCALGAVGVLALALVAAFPETLSLTGDRDAQVTQGAVFLPIALAATLAAGVLFARLSDGRWARASLPFSPRAQGAIAVAAIPLVLAAGIAISSSGKESTDVPQGAARIARSETNRGHYWRVALDSFASHPVGGIGTGGFEAEFLLKRGEDEPALDAHSLYLETLMELGIVGAAFLAVFVGGLAWGVGRAVARTPSDPAVAPAAAVLAALAVHVGVDWDWEMPAVILPALILAAAAMRGSGSGTHTAET
jgi:O-antigen ligase